MIAGSPIGTTPKAAVVFDLLTALLDSWSVWDAVAGSETQGRRWRARYLELTYQCGAYKPYEDLVAEAAADSGLPSTAATALRANWDNLTPWPEAPRVLARLRAQGLRLGVVTNCSTELGRRAAARCVIPFDAVVTAEEVGFYKPCPEPYRAVLAALNISVEDALFVAGSSADVAGAAGVGMQVVWHNRIGLPAQPGSKPLREAASLDAALDGFV
jgi:2-haloalkanoic acid dehalogenase type II